MSKHHLWELIEVIFITAFTVIVVAVIVLKTYDGLRWLVKRLIKRFRLPSIVTLTTVEPIESQRRGLRFRHQLTSNPNVVAPHDFINDAYTAYYAVRFWQLIMSNTYDKVNMDDDNEEGEPCPSSTPNHFGSRIAKQIPSVSRQSSSSTLRAGGLMMMRKSRSGQRRLKHYVKRTTTSRSS